MKAISKVNLSLIGYYEKDGSEPTYDPDRNGPCIICGQPLAMPMRVVRFVPVGGTRQCFYRTHRDCVNATREAEIQAAVPVSMIENAEVMRNLVTEVFSPLLIDLVRIWCDMVRGIWRMAGRFMGRS